MLFIQLRFRYDINWLIFLAKKHPYYLVQNNYKGYEIQDKSD